MEIGVQAIFFVLLVNVTEMPVLMLNYHVLVLLNVLLA
jgi:hypothetical protein